MRQRERKAVLLPFGKTIYQSKAGQGISSDTSLLVETVLKEEKDKSIDVLDAGSGNGIIAIMLKHYRSLWQLQGLEIQSHLVELARDNAKLSGCKIDFLEADIKTCQTDTKFDLIVMNPPFYKLEDGNLSPIYERAVSRHEVLCNLEDIIAFIKNNIKDSGKCYLLHLCSREDEIKEKLNQHNMILDKKYKDSIAPNTRTYLYRIRK